MKPEPIRTLLGGEPDRLRRFVAEAADIRLDVSRCSMTGGDLSRMLRQLEQGDLPGRRDDLIAGGVANRSEGRPAWHTRLRDPAHRSEHDAVLAFAEAVREGRWRPASGARITSVLNVGIGGSHLGPELVIDALAELADGPEVHFLSNIDTHHARRLLRQLDAASTLVLINSKSFGTIETLDNWRLVHRWLESSLPAGQAAYDHCVALTANPDAARSAGVPATQVFEVPSWVGGRYSLWSASGLSIALAIGQQRVHELLTGAHRMDSHFATAPLERNLPVLLALVQLWHGNVLDCGARAVVPYDDRLRHLVGYLQQLEMESNGKSVDADGRAVAEHTIETVFGGVGSNVQHSFFQALHQGTRVVPVELIGVAQPDHSESDRHHRLLANMLAQATALVEGRDTDDPHRQCPGDRPSTLILLPKLRPDTLGALLALFEHRVFVLACWWGINPFDQWGVELGKALATPMEEALRSGHTGDLDEASGAAVRWLRERSTEG